MQLHATPPPATTSSILLQSSPRPAIVRKRLVTMAPTIGNPTRPSRCQVKGDVCCRSADWTDVAKFFIANYLTHAFTVVATPGARKRSTICFMVLALFTPFVGVCRALIVIARCALWSKGDLRKAHKAGALYTLIKVTKDDAGKIHVEPRVNNAPLAYTSLCWRSQP